MKIKPYVFARFGSSPLKTYYIHDGFAEIESFGGGRESIPLTGADIKIEKSAKAFLGFGTIKITSANGTLQEWTKLPDVEKVYKALVRASKGQSPEPTPEELKLAKNSPPSDITFGEQIAFVPAISGFLYLPFSRQLSVGGNGLFRSPNYEADYWVNQGKLIRSFGVSKHNPDCMTCGSTFRKALRLIDTKKHGLVILPVYSPVSGLVLEDLDPFGTAFQYLVEYEDKNLTPAPRDKFMSIVLLPKYFKVPETIERSVEEMCNIAWQHRQAMFRNSRVITDACGSVEDARKEIESPKIYSDESIDEELSKFKQRKIIVRELSTLPDRYKLEVKQLKSKYPKNFQ